MDFLSAHPITICLAIISAVIWTAGNRSRNKIQVLIGLVLSIAAIVTFVLGK